MAKRATEIEVRAVPEPAFTKTWHPISHGKFIDAMDIACHEAGITVVDKNYDLNFGGTQMFGRWTLDLVHGLSNYMLGLRSSINATFAKGVCAGTWVTACSNGMLSGTYIEFRRHTSGLDMDRLIEMARKALKGAIAETKKLAQWHENLRNYDVNENEFKALTFDMMKIGLVSPTKFQAFLDAHKEERGPKVHSVDFTGRNLHKWNERDTSLYTVHGAVTRLMRKNSLSSLSRKGIDLIKVCDDYIELKKAA